MELTLEGVANVAGKVTLELDERVTLLAGSNAAGKSTMLRALAAVLSNERCPVTGKVDKDANAMVHREPVWGRAKEPGGRRPILRYQGPREAVASVVGDGFSRTIRWMAGDPGKSEILGTATAGSTEPRTATGLDRFVEMDKDARYDLLCRVVDARPTEEEFKKACPGASAEALAKVLPLIVRGEWDMAEKFAKGEAATARANWRTITGKNYSEAAAKAFKPEGTPDDAKYRTRGHLETLSAKAKELRAKLKDMPEPLPAALLAELQQTVAGETVAMSAVLQAQAEERGARETYDAAARTLHENPPPGFEPPQVECPACRVMLILGTTTLRLAVNKLSVEERNAVAAAHDEAGKALMQARTALERATRSLTAAQNGAARVGDAKEKLATYENVKEGEQNRGDLQRDLDEVMRVGTALTKLFDAQGWHEVVLMWKEIEGQCAVDGLRATVMERQLARLNDDLFRAGQVFPQWEVSITGEMEVEVSGRPWLMLCGGEKWYASALIQLVLAKAEGAKWLLLDDADTLSGTNRARLLGKVLGELSKTIRVVVASAIDAEETPDMARYGLGRTYWIDAGSVRAMAA